MDVIGKARGCLSRFAVLIVLAGLALALVAWRVWLHFDHTTVDAPRANTRGAAR